MYSRLSSYLADLWGDGLNTDYSASSVTKGRFREFGSQNKFLISLKYSILVIQPKDTGFICCEAG